MKGPAGELVAVYTHATTAVPPGGPTCTTCANGTSTGACGHNLNPYKQQLGGRAFPTQMRWTDASSNFSHWSEPVTLFNATAGRMRNGTYCDNNLAGVILSNGSFVGIWRECSLPGTWTTVHPVTAAHWAEPSSYQWHDQRELWAHAGAYPTGSPVAPPPEDPMVWRDAEDGVFHAVFHDRSGESESIHGGHAFSTDGLQWTYTGVAYDNVVEYADGWRHAFSNRERPHLVFDGETPIALTTGVRYSQEVSGDYCYTHLQPLLTSGHAPRGNV